MNINISLLITTYNDPGRLEITLEHLLRQRPQPWEIIVCDDGSQRETQALVERFGRRFKIPLRQVYQEDRGWDAPGIRNLGAITARGNYLVMTDGDCVPHPKLIQDHLLAAEAGCFVFGDRSHVVQDHVSGFSTRPGVLLAYLLSRRIHKRSAAVRYPFAKPTVYQRAAFATLDQLASLALGGNFGVWKSDFLAVNGFDESFKTWWQEDAECAARLLHLGLTLKKYRRKCLVYHLDHGGSPAARPEAWQFAEHTFRTQKRESANGIQQRLARMIKLEK